MTHAQKVASVVSDLREATVTYREGRRMFAAALVYALDERGIRSPAMRETVMRRALAQFDACWADSLSCEVDRV